jgi:adenosine 3'-phospho 5'-phosphosulfate transporter B3
MLGYLEVLGVTVCSYFEKVYVGEKQRNAPWSSYTMLCLCLLVSSGTSNLALNYINYPTKVVFRSCKVLLTLSILCI